MNKLYRKCSDPYRQLTCFNMIFCSFLLLVLYTRDEKCVKSCFMMNLFIYVFQKAISTSIGEMYLEYGAFCSKYFLMYTMV